MRFALILSLLLMLGGVLTAAPAQSDSGGGEPSGPKAVKPFQIHVPNEVLSDLHRRLANARWPDQLPGTSWEYGADIHTVRELATYWQNGFDWRAEEKRINRFHQFTTQIDGQTIYFICERSARRSAIPLLLIHGWPGSILEFLSLIEPLTNPPDQKTPAFHVIIPALPGFGFSGPTTKSGWDTLRIAKAFAVLMDRLGYSRYGIQGGDWGSTIARQMARVAPAQVIGMHLNFLPVPPPSLEAISRMGEEEHRRFSAYWEHGRSAFYGLQSTEPQTIAYALNDSPVGWLAWLTVKFQDLTDNDGDFLHAIDRDTFLSNVTLYWVTNTVGSSMRIYREHKLSGGDEALAATNVPIAYAVFPKDVIAAPEDWIDHKYNIVQKTEMPRGGHFAVLEEPELLLKDVRAFFAKMELGGPADVPTSISH
jgi:pimeloyl-ACP methyl ester carboxylesterase